MRRLLVVCAGGVLALAGCRSARVAPGTRVVEVNDLHQTFSGNLAAATPSPMVLHVPAGTRMPLSASMTTPFVHTEPGASPPQLVFDRDVWLYFGEPMQISYDGTTWQGFTDAFKGKLSFGLDQSGPTAPPAARVALVAK